MILEFENHNPKYVSSGTSWKVEFIHSANFIHYEKNSRDGYNAPYDDKDNTCSRYGVFRGGEKLNFPFPLAGQHVTPLQNSNIPANMT